MSQAERTLAELRVREELVMDTVVCLTLDQWETVSGQFDGLFQ